MDLAQLTTFCRVYEERSITRAAELGHLSQPAVSRQIQALEVELGETLFARGARRLEPTEAGAILYQHAKGMLKFAEDCRRELADRRDLARGQVVVGAGMTTTIFNLPGVLASFRQKYPGLDVVIKTGASAAVAGMVLEGEVDLGFVTSPVGDRRLVERALFEDEIVLVGEGQSAAPASAQSQVDLAGQRMIAFPKGSGFREDVEKALATLPHPPRVAMELDSVEAIKEMVKVGLGIAYLPRVAVAAELESGRLVQLAAPTLVRTTRLIYRVDGYLSRAAAVFLGEVSGMAVKPA